MKKCNVCETILTIENTYLLKGQLRAKCKDCWGLMVRKWKDDNREDYREQKRLNARKNRKTGYEWEKKHPKDPLKDWARVQVAHAVRSGKLTRPKLCEKCGQKPLVGKVEGHHYAGYIGENVLRVEWVCPPCHRQLDANLNRKKVCAKIVHVV